VTEWPRIEREADDPAYLLSRYVALLGLIPPLFGFVGACLIGATVPGIGSTRASLIDGLFGAIFGYIATFAIVLLLGLIIDLSAPLFGGRKDFASAFKLAIYSYTPIWLAGVFLLLPGLHFLALTGFYGAYVVALGLPRMMKSPERQSRAFVVLVVACAFVLTYAAAATQRAMFGTPGL
jgi:Yip1 domain